MTPPTSPPSTNPPTHPGALHELALFAGAGGGILGGHLLGWRTVCAVERDPYAAAVLAQRQNDGALYPFPIWDDVCTFDGRPWRGRVDVVSGGFPCQDISVAGGGAGLSGERSGLWREFARIIREVGPTFVFVENSPALAFRGLDTVLGDLAEMGYDAEWGVLGADDVGAPHKRERMWIVGQLSDALHHRLGEPVQHVAPRRGATPPDARSNGPTQPMADAGHLRGRDGAEPDQSERPSAAGRGQVANTEREGLEGHVGRGEPERPADRERSSQLAAHRSCSDVPDAEGGGREADRLAIGAGPQRPGAVIDGGDPWRARGPADESHPNVPDAERFRLSGQGAYWFRCDPAEDREGAADSTFRERVGYIWGLESLVGRVAHGVAHRVDRLRAIGNGQVPLVAAVAWTELHRRLNA